MYADVVFTSKGDPQGMNVPSSSVVTSTERKYVIVQRNNKLEKVDVTTGNRSAGRIQINGNLQPGEMVILNANDDIASSN
jgi:multidrug efflux pump subunit AcrA (membrane-fusion protein)